METTAKLIFITGGVRSGKSSYAEKLALGLAKKEHGNLHYIATGVSMDREMNERIARHQQERMNSIIPWKTWEQSQDLWKIAKEFNKSDILLLDCVTTLLNNVLFSTENILETEFQRTVIEGIINGIIELRKRCRILIVVSNEVLQEPLGSGELVALYSRLLGKIHQEIVKMADKAYLVEAGLPLLMKGEK